jgi:hypothetical protein
MDDLYGFLATDTGSMFKLLALKVLTICLFFIPLKGVLKRVTGFKE